MVIELPKKHELNGRDLKSLFSTALAMVESFGESVGLKHFKKLYALNKGREGWMSRRSVVQASLTMFDLLRMQSVIDNIVFWMIDNFVVLVRVIKSLYRGSAISIGRYQRNVVKRSISLISGGQSRNRLEGNSIDEMLISIWGTRSYLTELISNI